MDRTRTGQGQIYAGVWEVWRRCQRFRVGSTECDVWKMEDGSIGVRTGLSLISEETSRGDTRELYCQGGD